ncbi:MAG TPA: hypothetical protein VFE05_20185 [Longimicrobiaceae bacterium]|jgi:hypothetical protein|nr:hypothetical protein [Longimicrobiaceae bacterium]
MHPSRVLVTAALAVLTGATLGLAAPGSVQPVMRSLRARPATAREELARLAPMAFGHSGKLRMLFTDQGRGVELPIVWAESPQGDVSYAWQPLGGSRSPGLLGQARLSLGVQAPLAAGMWQLRLNALGWTQTVDGLAVVTRVPLSDKRNGYLNGYRIGDYVTESSGRGDAYAPPPGFIEVTPENRDMPVSEHFTLGSFVTHDQADVWPKYVALDLRLIDKLELTIQELNAMGVRTERMAVMSGYRTPAYNIQGVGEGGRALLSRHTYGDASDVWVDNDANGYMDDLNGDGRIDTGDGEVILRAVDRVEAKYPELTGGVGVYRDNGSHGPFVHIDARGTKARW